MSNCKKKNIHLEQINGYTEHMHCLFSLGNEQSMAQVAQLIKGESSFWINQNKLTIQKFAWQDDYYAVSVSPSHVERVTRYIKNQEIHHAKQTWVDEEDLLIKKCGFSIVKG